MKTIVHLTLIGKQNVLGAFWKIVETEYAYTGSRLLFSTWCFDVQSNDFYLGPEHPPMPIIEATISMPMDLDNLINSLIADEWLEHKQTQTHLDVSKSPKKTRSKSSKEPAGRKSTKKS